MRKTHLSAFMVFITSVGFSQTDISGGIFQNTTWSPSGNPYIASENVVVFEDVNLTIEPGVIVKFNPGTSLEIRGKLTAIGNATDSIRFTSNLVSPSMNSWDGLIVKGTNPSTGNGDQITMEFCVGEFAHYFIDLGISIEGPYAFRNCSFRNNYQTNYHGGVPYTIFDHCKFDSNINAIGFSGNELKVKNSEFVNNEYGVEGEYTLVDSCLFSNHSGTAILGNLDVRNCTIVNNNIGVDCYFETSARTFIWNTIRNNNVGVRMQKFRNGIIDFTNNTICNNASYNLELLDFNNAIIPFNCWCSEDSSYIRSTIFDGYMNTDYGLVFYTPLGEECMDENVGTRPDFRNNAPIDVFPNPFINELNIEFSSMERGEVTLYNLNGDQKLKQSGEQLIKLNTSSLPAGIFIYELITKDRQKSYGRVIKIR